MSWFVFACLLAVAYSHPSTDDLYRIPRNAEFSSSSSSANTGAFASAGAGAFSSAGTAVSSGPGGVYAGTGNYGSGYGGGLYNGYGGYGSNGMTGAFVGPAGAFTSVGSGVANGIGPGIPPYPIPNPQLDFATFMQQYAASTAAQDALRNSQGVYGGVGTSSYGYYGPQGGQGSVNVYPPPAGGIDVRTGGNSGPVGTVSNSFPPPNGGYYGISSFSSSAQSDNNGQRNGYRTSSVSVNDNGKVTTYTAHDP